MIRISLITATYNPGESVLKTLDSVRENGVFEHRIVDNVSQDPVMQKIISAPPDGLIVTSEPDKGIYDAMNKGCFAAQGDVVACLNAGDYYLPGVLDVVRKAFEAHPEAGIVHGNIRVTGRNISPAHGLASFGGARIFHPACFMRKEVFERLGGFDVAWRICADLDLFLRAKRAGICFHYLGNAFPITDFALGGLSTVQRKKAAQEVRLILMKNGFSRLFADGFYLAATLRGQAAKLKHLLQR